MYRAGSVYDEIDKVIYDIYQDYDIKTFPVDEVEVCNKLALHWFLILRIHEQEENF